MVYSEPTMAMPLERLPQRPAPRPERKEPRTKGPEQPRSKRISFGDIAQDTLGRHLKTEKEASRYLSELAASLEHFDAKTARLPDGSPFAHLGWGEAQAQEMLDAAFSHYERLSKERRLAEQRLAEEDTVRAPIPAELRTLPVERPATRIQELENRKIVVETNLRELRSDIPGLKPSLLERAKAWWRNVADPQASLQTRQSIARMEQELKDIQARIEEERAALRQELRPTFIRTPRQALGDFGRDAASTFVPNIRNAAERDAEMANARARGEAPPEWEAQEREDAWDEWQAERKRPKHADTRARGAAAKEAEAEWDRMLAENEEGRRKAPKKTADRATIAANPAIFKGRGRVAKELANDVAAGLGLTDYAATKERNAYRKKEESAPLLDESEWTDADAFEADLDRPLRAEPIASINIEKILGPRLQKLPHAEIENIERVLRAENLDPAKEWQRINTQAKTRLKNDTAAYNVANAYIRNLAAASSGSEEARTTSRRNIEQLDQLLGAAKRQHRAARRPESLGRPDLFGHLSKES